MSELVVLQHSDSSRLSRFADVLDGRAAAIPWRLVEVDDPAALPELSDTTGLVVLGGTMSATEPEAHRWMTAEIELLSEAANRGVPVFGVCLGAHMLAVALGGAVARRERPEIGFLELTRTPAAHDDPVFAGWPDGSASLFVHEDEVTELPAGAEVTLAGSDGNAAWRAGDAWAVQFHPEVDADQLIDWAHNDRLLRSDEAAREQLADEAPRRARFSVPVGQALLGRFLDGVVRPRLES